ncbi:PLC-A [Umbelopsis sp. PMI_123]|nr:PLC-A [Umbelopsis sp. PMI_123]
MKFSLALGMIAASVASTMAASVHSSKPDSNENLWKFIKEKIKTVVVIVEENRSFDHMAGQFDYSPEIQGIAHRQFCNSFNISDPHAPEVCSEPIAMNIQVDNPEYETTDDMFAIYGTFTPTPEEMKTPKMNGFVTRQYMAYGGDENVAREAIDSFSIDHVPIQYALAKDNALVDEWYCAGPITTKPNRAFLVSGTSLGHGSNDNSFFTYTNKVKGFNNTNIFEVLSKKNVDWKHYYWGLESDAMYYYWNQVNAADKMIHGSQFFADAAKGELPPFTYLYPECCSYESFHPPSPIDRGEEFLRQVYNALRSSPQWDEILFIVTYDEHGGFADHMPIKPAPPPDNYTYTSTAANGKEFTYNFDTTGVRVPTYLISPWIPNELVVHNGVQPESDSVLTHTSVLAFLAKLWDLPELVLSRRVEWSSTFENVFESMRHYNKIEYLEPQSYDWGNQQDFWTPYTGPM